MVSAWDLAHPERVRESKRRYCERNREKLRVASLARYYANHERCLERSRKWAANNPEKMRAYGRCQDAKPHRKTQRGDYKARHARYRARNIDKLRERRRVYQARRRSDPAQRAVDAIRRRMRHVIKGQSKGAFALLGYTADKLREHLHSRFKPGMTWSNYGLYGEKWHVDHIRPVSSFKLPDQLVECFSLTNLQPLWAEENLRKHNAMADPKSP